MTCKVPCKECPFARAVTPSNTGGSSPLVYVGQASGPFLLNCRMDHRYPETPAAMDITQCAGAAIFRANLGVDAIMPHQLLQLPPNRELVFASNEEFIAHHFKVPLVYAEAFLAEWPYFHWVQVELKKQDAKVLLRNASSANQGA